MDWKQKHREPIIGQLQIKNPQRFVSTHVWNKATSIRVSLCYSIMNETWWRTAFNPRKALILFDHADEKGNTRSRDYMWTSASNVHLQEAFGQCGKQSVCGDVPVHCFHFENKRKKGGATERQTNKKSKQQILTCMKNSIYLFIFFSEIFPPNSSPPVSTSHKNGVLQMFAFHFLSISRSWSQLGSFQEISYSWVYGVFPKT